MTQKEEGSTPIKSSSSDLSPKKSPSGKKKKVKKKSPPAEEADDNAAPFAESLSTTPNPVKPKSSRQAVATPPPSPPAQNRSSGSRDIETPETIKSNRSSNNAENTLTINHVNSASRSGAIMGMSKPVMALVSLLTLGSLGAGLWGWFTIPGLYDQIEELEAQVDRLAGEVDRFEVLNDELNSTVTELKGINQDLNRTAGRLRDSVDDLEHENDRLTKLNDNLESIVGFLNETSAQIGETLDEVTDFLAEQITASRVIVMETLENTYQQDISNWDCAYRYIFWNEPFVNDENIPIGLNNLGAVLDYVDDRILGEMCASRSDFESYLEGRYSLTSMTSNQLYQGVAVYTRALFNYYFPDPGMAGLAPEDWAEADYDCTKVPDFVFR